jgi:hypothetical protein
LRAAISCRDRAPKKRFGYVLPESSRRIGWPGLAIHAIVPALLSSGVVQGRIQSVWPDRAHFLRKTRAIACRRERAGNRSPSQISLVRGLSTDTQRAANETRTVFPRQSSSPEFFFGLLKSGRAARLPRIRGGKLSAQTGRARTALRDV